MLEGFVLLFLHNSSIIMDIIACYIDNIEPGWGGGVSMFSLVLYNWYLLSMLCHTENVTVHCVLFSDE